MYVLFERHLWLKKNGSIWKYYYRINHQVRLCFVDFVRYFHYGPTWRLTLYYLRIHLRLRHYIARMLSASQNKRGALGIFQYNAELFSCHVLLIFLISKRFVKVRGQRVCVVKRFGRQLSACLLMGTFVAVCSAHHLSEVTFHTFLWRSRTVKFAVVLQTWKTTDLFMWKIAKFAFAMPQS